MKPTNYPKKAKRGSVKVLLAKLRKKRDVAKKNGNALLVFLTNNHIRKVGNESKTFKKKSKKKRK